MGACDPFGFLGGSLELCLPKQADVLCCFRRVLALSFPIRKFHRA
jgi:hypothetical protein